MSAVETIKAAYAAFGRNDPSVLFAAMDPAIDWNEAEGTPLADRNPYVGPQAIGEGVFARLLAAIDNFTAVPGTFIDGGDHVVVLGRYRRHDESRRRDTRLAVLPRLPLPRWQGGDVPAVHGHGAVGAADEIAASDPCLATPVRVSTERCVGPRRSCWRRCCCWCSPARS